MSLRIKKIAEIIEELAPRELALGWDNVGLMVGNEQGFAENVLFALDCNEVVIDEAVALRAELIVTHHPLIFKPVKNLNYESALSRKLVKAITYQVAVYSAHTNLDIAEGGTNTVLANLLGLEETEPLTFEEDKPMGKTGYIAKELFFDEFINEVKMKLGAEHLTVNGDAKRLIKKVGICTGSGSDFIKCAYDARCDVYICGDVGYHSAQLAQELGLCIIDATHYLTEVIAIKALAEYVASKTDKINCYVSSVNGQTLHIV